MNIAIQLPQPTPTGVSWLFTLSALACVGCVSTNQVDIESIAADIPLVWSEITATGSVREARDLDDWWLRFSDPQLARLVVWALSSNTDVQQASAAIAKARALRDVAAAGQSVTLGYSTSAQRNFKYQGSTANSLQAGLNADWKPDISGVQQYALDASSANLMAAQALLWGVQSSIASGVALNYIALRSGQARMVIAQKNLASQQDTLQIVQWRSQAGLIGSVEVDQALVAAQQTAAQLPPLEQNIARVMHALAVQTGRPPRALLEWLTPYTPMPQEPLTLDISQALSPTATLLSRADVRAAQYTLARTSADVAQAQARRYPTFNLGANLGASAATASALSNSSSLVAGVVLSLAGNLFDGGALQAQVRAARATWMQARSAYRGTQLIALQEVEDALLSLRTDLARAEQLRGVVAAAERAAAMARQRFAGGLVDFQIVLDTQRSQLSAEDTKALADATVSSDQVRLYIALGGGWKRGPETKIDSAALQTTP